MLKVLTENIMRLFLASEAIFRSLILISIISGLVGNVAFLLPFLITNLR